MMKKSFSKIAIGCFLVFSIASCGRSNSGGSGGGGPTIRRGANFFNDKRSAQTLKTERQTFLDTNIVDAHSGNVHFNLTLPRPDKGDPIDDPNNNLRNPDNNYMPLTPVIHNYHNPVVNAPLVASLPLSFLSNIPEEIKKTIRAHDIDHLDLFFVAQEAIPGVTVPLNNPLPPLSIADARGRVTDAEFDAHFRDPGIFPTEDDISAVVGNPVPQAPDYVLAARAFPGGSPILGGNLRNATACMIGVQRIENNRRRAAWNASQGASSLKPAFWADPRMPNLNTISGPRWDGNLPMAIYQPNDPTIQDEVRINEVRSFTISVHDGLISDDTGHLRLVEGQHYSFWSLVISPIFTVADPTQPAESQTLRAIPDQYKAAVTLHWILPNTGAAATFRGFLQSPSTLRNVITNLDGQNNGLFTTDPGNPHRHHLEQLKLLVRE